MDRTETSIGTSIGTSIEADQAASVHQRSADRPSGRRRFRRVADQMPTKAFAYVGAGLVLLATAAFGGLGEAPPAAVPKLDVGEVYSNDEASVAIEQAIIADSIDGVYAYLEPGQKLVMLIVTAANNWDRPIGTIGSTAGGSSRFVDIFSLALPSGGSVDGDAANQVAAQLSADDAVQAVRADDGGPISKLQPGVPVRFGVVWVVDSEVAAAIAQTATLTVTINDLTYGRDSLVNQTTSWGDPVPAAVVEVAPDMVTAFSLAAPVESSEGN